MKQLKLLFVGLLLVAANGLFAQITFTEGTFEAVSYTHLDVYKRQPYRYRRKKENWSFRS